jgi:4-hydroxymandelate oxidase
MDRRLFSQLLTLGAGAWAWPGQSDPPKPGADPNAAPAVPGAAVDRGEFPYPPANVGDFAERARAVLPPATFDYISTGSTDELTLRDNVAAFQRLRLLPPLLAGVEQVALSTTLLGTPVRLPIVLAPVAGQSLFHPDGVLASARAAAAAGTILGVSSSAGHSVEEVAEATEGPKWFQLYVPRDRAIARRIVERVERAGYRALILTVDLGERKDADKRNRFALPRERLLKQLTDMGFPVHPGMTLAELNAINDQAWDPALSWEVFDWLRSITRLPLLVKGVLRPEDAAQAVKLGLDGVVVSNHGGRRLDGVPASIDQLEEVVAAVNGRATVLLDSGVRRGTDVLKALALGAQGVLIGRPYAWALAAGGEAGVTQLLTLLREELEVALQACGCASVRQVPRELVRRANA